MKKSDDVRQMVKALCANGMTGEVAYFLAEMRADINEIKGFYEKEPQND